MKNYFFILLLFSFCASSIAQISTDLIIVYNVEGKAKYASSPDAKFKKIMPGMKLLSTGIISLKDDAKVGLYYDEQLGSLNKNGNHNLIDVINDIELFEESDLASIFGAKVVAASHPGFASVKLKRSGFADTGSGTTAEPEMPPKKKGKEGHGNKEFQLIRVSPAGGKVSGDTIFFRWRVKDKSNAPDQFKIMVREVGKEEGISINAKGSARKAPAKRFKLEAGKSYEWQVSSATDSSIASPPVRFDFKGSDEELAALKKLQDDAMYQQADAVTKMIMEATVLEQKDYIMSAAEKYRKASRVDKKNKLARNLYKSFLWDYDIIN